MKIDNSWYVKPKDPKFPLRIGAGGIVIRLEKKTILVGLVKEGDLEGYILPKGGNENGETLLETAKREIQEEAGIIDLKFLEDLGFKERLTFEKKYWSKTKYFLFLTRQITGVATDPYESYIIKWFDFNKLPYMFWPEQKDLVEENKVKIRKLFGR